MEKIDIIHDEYDGSKKIMNTVLVIKDRHENIRYAIHVKSYQKKNSTEWCTSTDLLLLEELEDWIGGRGKEEIEYLINACISGDCMGVNIHYEICENVKNVKSQHNDRVKKAKSFLKYILDFNQEHDFEEDSEEYNPFA